LILAHASRPELAAAMDVELPAAYARGAHITEADVRVAMAATAPARYGRDADEATRRVLRAWVEAVSSD
jgi:hypothetical protein